MEVVQAYKCRSCSMTSIYKASVIRHEAISCRKSNVRMTCLNCDNWIDNGIDHNGMDGQYRHEWQDFGCLKDQEPAYEARNININCADFVKLTEIK